MIETMSLCNVCYKKVPAYIVYRNGQAWMEKECDVHGSFEALVDPDFQHVSNFYQPGTMGKTNSIIIHISDRCNMKCPWCYYVEGKEKMHDLMFYDQLLREPYKGFSFMFSGGEPTIRPDYVDFVEQAYRLGWNPSTITNMITLSDEKFFKRTMNEAFVTLNTKQYRFAMSFQHPKNYSEEIYNKKLKTLDNMDKAGLKAACMMFSIQSLDELDFIKDFYDETKHLYGMLRIRTMFHNWGNKGEKTLFLSELHKAFLNKFSEYCPVQSVKSEQSNIYCLYMITKEGREISLASAPTVENLDYHICSRPVYMLGRDYRCYPVPIAQIVSEGIDKGWKDGFQIKGV
jgi:molybdenum cofactor biosynthesis enzyme MoaA